MRLALLAVVVLMAVAVSATPKKPETEVVAKILGDFGDDDEGLSTIFDSRGGHQTSEGLRSCYDTIRRVAACPISKTQVNGKFMVGTRNKPLECRPEDRSGSLIMRVAFMLLRSMSKSRFVKNAYFTDLANGGKDKPTNQHFLDVFLGQVVYNVLNSADQSAVKALTGPAAKSYAALTTGMWASFKEMFQDKKERIAMGSTAFRSHLRNVISVPTVLFGACRRTKFVLASMDVGADVAKYASERRSLIGKLINKVVTLTVKNVAGAVNIGGDAAGAVVALISELVDSAFDASKAKLDRKYAASAVLLDLFSGFVPPKTDVPPVEAMLTANAAQSVEILRMIQAIGDKVGVARRQPVGQKKPPSSPPQETPKTSKSSAPQKSAPSTPPVQTTSSKSKSSKSTKSGKFRTIFQSKDVASYGTDQDEMDSFLQMQQVPENPMKPIAYDEGPECDVKVKALLEVIEKMLEDEPTGIKKEETDGIVTATYTEINKCGPDPNIMGEKENVLRSKAILKLIGYFIKMPDASDIEAESWLAKTMRIANTVVDKATEAVNMFTDSSGEGGF